MQARQGFGGSNGSEPGWKRNFGGSNGGGPGWRRDAGEQVVSPFCPDARANCAIADREHRPAVTLEDQTVKGQDGTEGAARA